ncbi:hypothetical protein LR48_Vigan07g113800 [Vigna angularis]|uniref:Uncharacterized protein n=1 Tax=Phaseolus angularis TaxID=3914 RepID=A0A0L9UY08_PHAAN|nr:hypothetical protein LR48_Vigan07g113800 [Vigna angularis]
MSKIARYIHPRQEGDRSACANTDRPIAGVSKRALTSADVKCWEREQSITYNTVEEVAKKVKSKWMGEGPRGRNVLVQGVVETVLETRKGDELGDVWM